MPRFGNMSQTRLDTCHIDIRTIMSEVIKIYDVSVLEGYRSTEKQIEYYETGRSKLDGVHKLSKHQGRVCLSSEAGMMFGELMTNENGESIASMAIDIMPYKKGYNAFSGNETDLRRFYFMMGIVRSVVERLLLEGKINHRIRFGLDWDSDDIYSDQNFDDLPHMELVEI